MARKRSGSEEEGGSWMDTYGDMVTLILTFFVMLYSMSSIDQQKWQYIAQAFSSRGNVINKVVAGETDVEEAVGNLVEIGELNPGEVPQNFDQLYQYIVQYVDDNGLSDTIEVERGESNVALKFRDNIFFGPDSGVLLQEGKDVLDGIGMGIGAVNQYIMGIKINGHTAEAEYSLVNDRDLSTERANSVLKYLDRMGIIKSEQYSAQGFGKYRPLAPNDTEENRRKNRRVEIIIIRNDVDFTNPKVIQELLQMDYGNEFVLPVADADGDRQEEEASSES